MGSAESRPKILLIDDDDSIRDSLGMFLDEIGYQVVDEADGEMGLARFVAERPSLVISDIQMPYVDGLSVLEAIREKDPHTPFIVISGAGRMKDAVSALRMGAHDYFEKPILDLELLELSIERALRQQALIAENTRNRQELEASNKDLEKSLEVLERDQQAARRIQEAMLPPNPIEIHSGVGDYFWRPSMFISGDFLDSFDADHRFSCFYLADVSGHGAPAAFVTVFLKHISMAILRQFRTRDKKARVRRTPSNILAEINSEMLEVKIDRLATMVLVIVDNERNRLFYSTAGHLPRPIIKRANGDAQYLSGGGLSLGLSDVAAWQTFDVALETGDTVVLASDGVFELMKQGEVRDNEAQFLYLVEKSSSLDELRSSLQVDEHESLADDVTLLWQSVGNFNE